MNTEDQFKNVRIVDTSKGFTGKIAPHISAQEPRGGVKVATAHAGMIGSKKGAGDIPVPVASGVADTTREAYNKASASYVERAKSGALAKEGAADVELLNRNYPKKKAPIKISE